MERRTFSKIWKCYVDKALKQNHYYTSVYLGVGSEAAVFDKYERIKHEVKKHYFSNDLNTQKPCTINRHKRAAALCYAFNEVCPIIYRDDPSQNNSLDLKYHLINQYHAFYLGLASLLLDYKQSSIERIQKDFDSVFFCFPETPVLNVKLSNGSTPNNSYVANVCRDLLFAKKFKNFNLLTMENVFFLLETFCCRLTKEDLIDGSTMCD